MTALAIALSLGSFGGCLVGQDTGGVSSDKEGNQSASALRDESPSGGDGTPLSCSRVWNAVAMDSVLHCPDPRPPKPR